MKIKAIAVWKIEDKFYFVSRDADRTLQKHETSESKFFAAVGRAYAIENIARTHRTTGGRMLDFDFYMPMTFEVTK